MLFEVAALDRRVTGIGPDSYFRIIYREEGRWGGKGGDCREESAIPAGRSKKVLREWISGVDIFCLTAPKALLSCIGLGNFLHRT